MSSANFVQLGKWSQCWHCFNIYAGEHYCGAPWQQPPRGDFPEGVPEHWVPAVHEKRKALVLKRDSQADSPISSAMSRREMIPIADAELLAAGYEIPKEGTHVPTRAEFCDLLQEMFLDAGGTHFSQPLAERLAQYLDAIYKLLAEAATPALANTDTVRMDWIADHEDAWPTFRRLIDPDGLAMGVIGWRDFVDEMQRLQELSAPLTEETGT